MPAKKKKATKKAKPVARKPKAKVDVKRVLRDAAYGVQLDRVLASTGPEVWNAPRAHMPRPPTEGYAGLVIEEVVVRAGPSRRPRR